MVPCTIVLRSHVGLVFGLGTTLPQHGLPKVHKPDVPLHPIVSFVSSPMYALSEFLASLLAPIVGLSDSHVRSSQQFAQFITNQNVPDSEVLVSLDVVSLITRVPTIPSYP